MTITEVILRTCSRVQAGANVGSMAIQPWIGFDCNTVISVKLQRDENPDIISLVDGEGRENKSERQKATVLGNKV